MDKIDAVFIHRGKRYRLKLKAIPPIGTAMSLYDEKNEEMLILGKVERTFWSYKVGDPDELIEIWIE